MNEPADYLAAMLDALAEGDAGRALALRDLALDAAQEPAEGLGGPSAEGLGGPSAEGTARSRAAMTEAIRGRLSHLIEARAVRKEGEEWETAGRRYKRVGGKTVRVAKGKGEPAKKERPAKLTVDQAHAMVTEAGADPKALARALLGLTVPQVKELRAKMGMTKGAGAKQKLADELVAKVVAGGQDAANQGQVAGDAPAGGDAPAAPARGYSPDEEAGKIDRPKYAPGQKLDREELKGVLAKAPNAAVRNALMRQIMEEAAGAANKGQPVARHGMSQAVPMKGVTVGGVAFAWEEGTEATGPPMMAAWLSSNVPAALWGANREVVFTKQGNKMDSYWEKAYNMPGLVSNATGGDGTICVYNSHEPRRNSPVGTMNHESGHNLAARVWGSTNPDPHSRYGVAQRSEGPVSRYGAVSPAEDFAEACMTYADPTGKRLLQSNFPGKYAALEELFATHG